MVLMRPTHLRVVVAMLAVEVAMPVLVLAAVMAAAMVVAVSISPDRTRLG